MSKPSSEDGERGNKFLSLRKYALRMTKNAVVHGSFVRRTSLFSERNLFPRFLALATAGLLFVALPVFAKPRQKPVAAIEETAVIYVTGSTNTRPSTIVVFSGGGAFVDGQNRGLPLSLNHRLFNQLKVSMPLTGLPGRHGMQSASFGTATYIIFRGERTPDLTLPGNDLAKALKADVTAIMDGLNGGMIIDNRKR